MDSINEKNRIQCLNCMETIESFYNHNFVTCKCGDCSVDGGPGYGGRILCKNSDRLILLPTDDKDENIKRTQNFRNSINAQK